MSVRAAIPAVAGVRLRPLIARRATDCWPRASLSALQKASGAAPARRGHGNAGATVPGASTTMLSRSLVSGLGLSGLWHGGALALAVVAGIFQPGRGGDPGPVAEVSLMSAAAFDAMISVAPEVAASPPPAPPPVEGDDVAVAEFEDAGAVARLKLGDLMDAGPVDPVLPPPPVPQGPGPVADASMVTEPALAGRQMMAETAARAAEEDGPGRAAAPSRPEAPAADAAPEAARAAAPVQRPQPIKRAAVPDAPSGSGRAAPVSDAGGTAKASPGAEKSLLADWGGSLRQKVERARRSPAGAAGQTGKVTLRLSVATSGRVLGVAVLRSSGVAALDTAAVDAVRRAGRLPKAPKGLGAASYDFNLPVVFTR